MGVQGNRGVVGICLLTGLALGPGSGSKYIFVGLNRSAHQGFYHTRNKFARDTTMSKEFRKVPRQESRMPDTHGIYFNRFPASVPERLSKGGVLGGFFNTAAVQIRIISFIPFQDDHSVACTLSGKGSQGALQLIWG